MFIIVPFWLCGYKFRHPGTLDKMVSTFIFSHITVILAVYLLCIIGIYYRFSLILLLILICFFYRFFADPASRGKLISRFLYHLKNLADSVELSSVVIRNQIFTVRQTLLLIRKKIKNPFALLVLIAIFLYHMYITGYHSLTNMFYGTSDMYLHTEWAKFMQENVPFIGGVYPMGFHAVSIALADFFGFNFVTVMRMLGPVIAFLMLFTAYYLLSRTMRSSFAVLFAIGIYAVSALFPNWATERHFLALPQEYGAIFLYLCAYYLWAYLKEVKRLADGGILKGVSLFFESYDLVDIAGLKKKKAWYRMTYGSPKWYLVHLTISLALTFSIHPFITAFTGLMCLIIFLTHLRYLNKQAFSRLVLAVLIAFALAVLPMALGILKGNVLNRSFLWATSLVTEQAGIMSEEGGADDARAHIFKHIYDSLEGAGQFRRADDLDIVWLIPFFCFCILGIISAFIRYKNRERSEIFAAFSLYSFTMLLLYILAYLNIFTVMEYSRLYAYFNYSLPLVIAIGPELLYTLFHGDSAKWGGKIRNGIYLGLVTAISITAGVMIFNQYGFKYLQRVAMTQHNGAVTAYYQIRKEFPRHSWIIISSFVEYPQVFRDGFHYELSELVFGLYEGDTEPIIIDSENIFIYIVKRANKYGYLDSLVRLGEGDDLPFFDPNMAILDFNETVSGYGTATAYYNLFINNYMQAKALAWAEEFRENFPAEMRIYYEDENIIVYHLKQNIYELNDFRIVDYKGV